MNTTDFVKTALTVFKEANRLDLSEELVQLRQDKLAVEEQNLILKKELQELRNSLNTEKNVRFEGGLHWLLADPLVGPESKTPICGNCWDSDRVVARQILEEFGERIRHACRRCDKVVIITPVQGYRYPLNRFR